MPPFVYNRATKKFVLVSVPADPASPEPITWALANNTDCCCCPCCQLAPGAQTYTCVDSEKKGDCSGAGGVPKCDAASCTPNPCCNGACCIDGQCSIKADAICASLGGVFKGCGTTCDGGICDPPPPGAACGCAAGTPSVVVSATHTEGSSCAGFVLFNSALQFVPQANFWTAQGTAANGDFFSAFIYCNGGFRTAQVGYNPMFRCLFENGQYTAYTSFEYPVRSAIVNGQCRLQQTSFSDETWPGFGLILSATFNFNHV